MCGYHSLLLLLSLLLPAVAAACRLETRQLVPRVAQNLQGNSNYCTLWLSSLLILPDIRVSLGPPVRR